MAKKKIAKLTDQQYYEYIMSLKEDAALYCPNGEIFVPEVIKHEENEDKDNLAD